MNLIVGAVGASPERRRLVHRVLAQRAAGSTIIEHEDGAAWACGIVDSDTVAAVTSGSAGDTMWFGSGVRSGTDGSGSLLDAADDDLVAVRLSDGDVIAAVGRGNHRLFRTTFPEGGTLVSSNLAVVAEARDGDLGVDRAAEDFFLGFGFHPDGRTPFEGIDALAPGTRRSLGPGVSTVETVEPAAAAQSATAAGSVPDFDAAVDELHRRFVAIVEEQAGDDTRHACFLGGFDSALVASTLRSMGHEVATYTFGFGDARYEQARAEELARGIGAHHTWVRLTPESVFDGIEGFSTVFPQPGPQPHYQVHTLRASEQMRADGFGHAFSGDGCDAVFLGYPMVNTRARIIGALRRAPEPIVDAGLRLASTEFADRNLGHVARMVRSTLHSLRLPWPASGHLPTQYLDAHALRRLRRGAAPPQDETIEQIRERLVAPVAGLDRTRLAFNGAGMTGQSRAKVDGAVCATGVAQRSPFLHPDLKAFVSALPTEYLRPPGTSAGSAGKALLVEMARRYDMVPSEIIEMPKQSPVDSPIDAWYEGPLRPRVDALLRHVPFDIDHRFVDEMLEHKRAEDLFRNRISLGHHALQPIGLLCSYASFCSLVP